MWHEWFLRCRGLGSGDRSRNSKVRRYVGSLLVIGLDDMVTIAFIRECLSVADCWIKVIYVNTLSSGTALIVSVLPLFGQLLHAN